MSEQKNIDKEVKTPTANPSGKRKTGKAGGYTVLMTVLLLAALIVINLIVGALPSKITKLDSSTSKMYTLSETTEKYLSKLDEDITLWFICPGGQEDSQLRTFLDRYAELSARVKVRVADPIADPDFISKYTDAQLSEYSVIVESARRSKAVDYNDMYYYYNDSVGKMSASDYQIYNAYYGITAEPYFDGDNQLTCAVEYVTAEKLPTLYTLSGHGEKEMSETLAYYVDLSGYDTSELNIALDGDSIPDNCSCILIYAPELDLTADELQKLRDYAADGGHIFMISGSTSTELQNFAALCADFGLAGRYGTVCEGSAGSYYPNTPYYIYPTASSTHNAVSMIYSGSYRTLTAQSHAISASASVPDGFTVTELLTTTSKGYLKLSDGTQSDPETLSVASASENETTGARMVWLASPQFSGDAFINATNGANLYCFLNMLSWLCDSFRSSLPEISAVDISSSTLTVSESSATLWGAIFIFIIPIAVAAVGLVRWTRRRKK